MAFCTARITRDRSSPAKALFENFCRTHAIGTTGIEVPEEAHFGRDAQERQADQPANARRRGTQASDSELVIELINQA